MNYFELINATLLELNYATVSKFEDLTKIEHRRLKNVINRLNKEICNMNNDFYFRKFIKKLSLYPEKIEYRLELSGKIDKIVGNNGLYHFEPEYSKFYMQNPPQNLYGIYGEKYLFSPISEDNVKIFYSTDEFVMKKNGTLTSDFERETDKSIIPDNFVEKLFINGAAYNFKQNSAHPKYQHWKTEYDKALSELLSSAKKVVGSNISIEGGFRKL